MNSRFALTFAALGLALTACSMAGARPSGSLGPSATTSPPIPTATAASTSPPATVGAPTNHAGRLDGRQFVSVLVTRDGESVVLVPGTKIRLGFADGMLSASAGCNSMSGQYQLQDGLLEVEQLATTDMGCPQKLAEQDKWLADILAASPALALDGDDLVLTSGKTAISFLDRETAEPDQPLAGITWTLTTVIDGDAASSVPVGMDTTLLFDPNGTFTFSDGCNSGGGKYSTDGDTMNLSQVITTAMACDTTKEHSDVTAAIDAMFRATSIKFAIDHATLSLSETSGQHGLQYDAAVDVSNS